MDIQKLLGGLLHGGLRIEKKQKKSKLLKSGFRVGSRALTHGSKSLFKGSKSSLGLGALALAFAAYEHLQERSSSQGQPFAASAPTPVLRLVPHHRPHPHQQRRSESTRGNPLASSGTAGNDSG